MIALSKTFWDSGRTKRSISRQAERLLLPKYDFSGMKRLLEIKPIK
nr:MAG TPA: hypothetical protein [Caudoviricetes sp.]